MFNFINKIDLSIIKWIQNNLSFGLLDYVMYAITQLGDLYFFILIAMVLYWTYDKKFAYKFFLSFIAGTLVNSVAKVLVKRNRPFTHEGVKSIFTKSHGYSFPSGHSQATGSIFYSLNSEFSKKNRVVKYVLIAYLILIPFSRMYLGQHFLTDVIVGTLLGIVVSIGVFKLFDLMKDKEHIYPLFALPVVVILLIVFANKDYGAFKDLYVAAAGFIGFTSAYALEKIYVKHDVNTSFKNRLLKVLIGLVGIAIVYLGLSFLFDLISETSLLLDATRYMLVGLFAGLGAPYIFTKVFKN